jgi:hypothetical protein
VTELQAAPPAARGVFDGPADAADNVDSYLEDSEFGG